jgi:hypothetical protein
MQVFFNIEQGHVWLTGDDVDFWSGMTVVFLAYFARVRYGLLSHLKRLNLVDEIPILIMKGQMLTCIRVELPSGGGGGPICNGRQVLTDEQSRANLQGVELIKEFPGVFVLDRVDHIHLSAHIDLLEALSNSNHIGFVSIQNRIEQSHEALFTVQSHRLGGAYNAPGGVMTKDNVNIVSHRRSHGKICT